MKRALRVVGVLLFGLVVVLLGRTATFDPIPQPIPPAPTVTVDTSSAAARLAGAIRIPTISHQDPARIDEDAFLGLHAYLERSFPGAHRVLGREVVNDLSLLYTWRGSEPELPAVLFMAHLDVVPVAPGTKDDWVHPAFSGAIADGYIWGRGTLDVKSGVVGLLEAAELLVDAGFTPRRTIYFAFGHDEEVGGKAGAQVIAKKLEADGVKLDMVLDEGGAIVSGVVPGVEEPIAMVGIAEKGYVSLSLTVKGKGGHSSMPPEHTAIGVLSSAVKRLEDQPFEPTLKYSGRFFRYVAPKMPFLNRIPFANLWLFAPVITSVLSSKPPMSASIRTTTAVTMIEGGVKANVLPTEARAIVNFRIYPGETVQTVKAAVIEKVADERVQVELLSEGESFGNDPSPTSDIDGPAFALIERSVLSVAQTEGLVVAPYLVVGATDSRYFTGLSKNVYRFLFNRMEAEDLARVHGTNERVRVEDYAKTVMFYHEVLRGTDSL